MKQQHLMWFQRQIARNVWKVGQRIAPMWVIARRFNISSYKARRIVQELIDMGIVEKYHTAFYLMDRNLDTSIEASQHRLILKAKRNIEMLNLRQQGLTYNPTYVAFIKQHEQRVTVFFPLRQKKYDFNLKDEVYDSIIHLDLKRIVNRHKLK